MDQPSDWDSSAGSSDSDKDEWMTDASDESMYFSSAATSPMASPSRFEPESPIAFEPCFAPATNAPAQFFPIDPGHAVDNGINIAAINAPAAAPAFAPSTLARPTTPELPDYVSEAPDSLDQHGVGNLSQFLAEAAHQAQAAHEQAVGQETEGMQWPETGIKPFENVQEPWKEQEPEQYQTREADESLDLANHLNDLNIRPVPQPAAEFHPDTLNAGSVPQPAAGEMSADELSTAIAGMGLEPQPQEPHDTPGNIQAADEINADNLATAIAGIGLEPPTQEPHDTPSNVQDAGEISADDLTTAIAGMGLGPSLQQPLDTPDDAQVPSEEGLHISTYSELVSEVQDLGYNSANHFNEAPNVDEAGQCPDDAWPDDMYKIWTLEKRSDFVDILACVTPECRPLACMAFVGEFLDTEVLNNEYSTVVDGWALGEQFAMVFRPWFSGEDWDSFEKDLAHVTRLAVTTKEQVEHLMEQDPSTAYEFEPPNLRDVHPGSETRDLDFDFVHVDVWNDLSVVLPNMMWNTETGVGIEAPGLVAGTYTL